MINLPGSAACPARTAGPHFAQTSKLLRFTLRGLIGWTFVAALALGWFADHVKLAGRVATAERQLRQSQWQMKFERYRNKVEREQAGKSARPVEP
jgi:hypothetical protein